MNWNNLSAEDKKEYDEMFKEYFNTTIVKSSVLIEPEYCDDELVFHTSPELLNYFITYKRIEKIEKIKERICSTQVIKQYVLIIQKQTMF